MEAQLMFFFYVLVFYMVALIILQHFTQLNTRYTFQSQGIKNSTLKYILYWNEAYKNKGEYEEKKKNTI